MQYGRALGARRDAGPDEEQERDDREHHGSRHLQGVPPPHAPVQHPSDHGDGHPRGHRQQRLRRVLVVTSSHVFSPTMERKMAPVTIIPTAIAASISKKCRQNGDMCLLRRLTEAMRQDSPPRWHVRTSGLRVSVTSLVTPSRPWPVALAGDGEGARRSPWGPTKKMPVGTPSHCPTRLRPGSPGLPHRCLRLGSFGQTAQGQRSVARRAASHSSNPGGGRRPR